MANNYIKNEILSLRDFTPGILEDFYAYRSDRDLLRYQDFRIDNREALNSFYESQKNIKPGDPGEWKQLAIIHKNVLIGDCALKPLETESRIIEIGITLARPWHGKGLASKAIQLLLTFCFDQLDRHKCVAVVDARNNPSIRLFENCGFRREAEFKKHYWDKESENWFDEWHYGILSEDYIR